MHKCIQKTQCPHSSLLHNITTTVHTPHMKVPSVLSQSIRGQGAPSLPPSLLSLSLSLSTLSLSRRAYPPLLSPPPNTSPHFHKHTGTASNLRREHMQMQAATLGPHPASRCSRSDTRDRGSRPRPWSQPSPPSASVFWRLKSLDKRRTSRKCHHVRVCA